MQRPYDLTPEDYAILAKYRRTDARPSSPPIDSQRTEVFRPGPDSRLQPIPGWKTTGPLDVGTWAKNINWPAAGGDIFTIVTGGLGGMGAGGVGGLANAQRAAAIGATGKAAYDDLEKGRQFSPDRSRQR